MAERGPAPGDELVPPAGTPHRLRPLRQLVRGRQLVALVLDEVRRVEHVEHLPERDDAHVPGKEEHPHEMASLQPAPIGAGQTRP